MPAVSGACAGMLAESLALHTHTLISAQVSMNCFGATKLPHDWVILVIVEHLCGKFRCAKSN